MVGIAALGLLKFVPDIIDLFSSDKKGKIKKTAEVIGNLAKEVTGKEGDDAIAALSADPDLAYKFKLAVMADSHIEEEMRYADRSSAREMYKVHHQASDNIATRIMVWNLPTVAGLLLLNAVATFYLKDHAAVLSTIATSIGFVINALLKERQDVTGFHFGSSVGSKIKDTK